jgi:hypothetical protein
MSFDLVVRQQRRRRQKNCRLSNATTRMTIGQFWPQRVRYSSNPEVDLYHQEKCADTVMTPFRSAEEAGARFDRPLNLDLRRVEHRSVGTRREAYAAFRWYSWMRPPRRSRHTIDPVAFATPSDGPPSGICRLGLGGVAPGCSD